MVGGIVIVRDVYKGKRKKQILVQELLNADQMLGGCCIVFSEPDADIKRGDFIWWQSGKHYVTRTITNHPNPFAFRGETAFVEKEEVKIGYSTGWHTPQRQESAMSDWVKRYAWFPVRMTNGKWAWLRAYHYQKGTKVKMTIWGQV